jgi:hypothetical protein
MKKLRLLSLVAITSIALAQAGWAASHGGGGGGGFVGGGGFHGGGGGFRSGSFGGGAPHFASGGFPTSAPAFSSRGAGVGTRGGGVGFGMGRYIPYQSSPSSTVRSVRAGRSVNPSIRGTASTRPSAPVVTQNRPTVVPNRPAAGTPPARSPGNVAQRGLNGRTDHISEHHTAANWHPDWDRHHAHFFHHRFFVFDDGIWFGLDDGFFPWDYYPYYAFDYYPYEYYPGYYADVEPYYNNEGVSYSNVPTPDSTVAAVQMRLVQLGYYNGPADGIYGPLTRDAVARFQTDENVPVTGNLSAGTLQSLGVPGMASNS